MNQDDVAELVKLETQLAKLPGAPHGQLGHSIPWLVRIVREQQARIDDLEHSGIPGWLAESDRKAAERDAQNAQLAAQLSKLEADKLPSPDEYFRQHEKLAEAVEAKPAARKTRKKPAKTAQK